MSNEEKVASTIETFYKEAQQRGVYTSAQDSLIATWKTLSTSVLPSLGVDLGKMTVAELKEQLPELLATYGSKGAVKANTIQTYSIKGNRLIADFLQYNGAPDTVWFQWKQKNEKKSQQTSAAANARVTKKRNTGRVDDSAPPPPEDVGDASKDRHLLKLPNGRITEVHVPKSLRPGDVDAMKKQFDALMGYLQSQVDVTSYDVTGNGQEDDDN